MNGSQECKKEKTNHKTLISSPKPSRNGKISKVAKISIFENFAKSFIRHNGQRLPVFEVNFKQQLVNNIRPKYYVSTLKPSYHE